jgi:hypothetical protein
MSRRRFVDSIYDSIDRKGGAAWQKKYCGPGGNPELETELGSLSPYVQRKLMLLAGYC